MNVQYLYGVTTGDLELPPDLRGLEDRRPELVRHREVAAIVGELDAARAIGTRDDLLAHHRVLETLAEQGAAVLPFRFGGSLADRQAVVGELLEPSHDAFRRELRGVQGHVQLTLKGRYVEETVLGEVLRESPEIAERRERIRGLPEDAAHYERVRLGELIAQTLEDKAGSDAETALAQLAEIAERTIAHPPRGTEEVVDAAFLVRSDRRERFERAVEGLGEHWAGRVRLRLLGPLPPYDFAGRTG